MSVSPHHLITSDGLHGCGLLLRIAARLRKDYRLWYCGGGSWLVVSKMVWLHDWISGSLDTLRSGRLSNSVGLFVNKD